MALRGPKALLTLGSPKWNAGSLGEHTTHTIWPKTTATSQREKIDAGTAGRINESLQRSD